MSQKENTGEETQTLLPENKALLQQTSRDFHSSNCSATRELRQENDHNNGEKRKMKRWQAAKMSLVLCPTEGSARGGHAAPTQPRGPCAAQGTPHSPPTLGRAGASGPRDTPSVTVPTCPPPGSSAQGSATTRPRRRGPTALPVSHS